MNADKLLSWYRSNKRSLPWRKNQNPYFVWISEIMLQQTTVQVVIPYFNKFIATFPTVEDLARAPEDRVLSHWSGLGYYSRARNLQKAAKAIVALGYFPKTSAELLTLPGIGPYTAAAVASIAFNEAIAAVDGNVIRVITRLFDLSGDIAKRDTLIEIGKRAQELIRGQPPASHNQAMMELGATICTPKNPACLLCPMMASCQAHQTGTMLQRPVKKKNRKVETWHWEMFLIEKKGKIALIKDENGTPWLNHLWVLPGKARLWLDKELPPSDFKHAITHHKIFVQVKKKKETTFLKENQKNIKWFSREEITQVGLSSIVNKALTHGEKTRL